MVIGTLVLLVIAYKSSSVSIEIANTKIVLSSAISEVKQIKSELEVENKRLISANQSIEEKIESIEKSEKIPKGSILMKDLKTGIRKSAFLPVASMEMEFYGARFEALDAKIRSAEEAIKK